MERGEKMSVDPEDAVQGLLASYSSNPMWPQSMATETDELSLEFQGTESSEASMLCMQRQTSPVNVSSSCEELIENLGDDPLLSIPEGRSEDEYLNLRSPSPARDIIAFAATICFAAQPSSPPADEAMDTSAPMASVTASAPTEEPAEERLGRVYRRTRTTAERDLMTASDATARKGRGRRPSAAPKNTKTGQQAKRRTPVRECDLRCGECGKTYKKKEYLQRHRRDVHEHIKRKCPQCGDEFGTKTILNRHMKTKHELDSRGELLDEAKARCDYPGCNFTSHRKADKLRDHMRRIHKDGTFLRCRLTRGREAPVPCKFIFFTEERRAQHEKRRTAGHTQTQPTPRSTKRGRKTPDIETDEE